MMNQIANVLKSHGVEKGDRVAIYMPACPLAVASMLACARIGAVHSVVFAGFSAEALASRIVDGIDPRFFFFSSKRFYSFKFKTNLFF
jgi:acetyl-CoA synthetase